MAMDMRVTLNLSDGTLSRENLEDFLAAVPKEVDLKVELKMAEPDRPGEVRAASAKLVAAWKI